MAARPARPLRSRLAYDLHYLGGMSRPPPKPWWFYFVVALVLMLALVAVVVLAGVGLVGALRS